MRRGGPSAFSMQQTRNPAVASSTLVRCFHHLLLLKSGRNAAKAPSTTATVMKAASAANQLLDRHQGRNDQVRETSVAAGQVDAQKQSPKTSAAERRPVTSPTTKPLLRLGCIMSLNTPNEMDHRRCATDVRIATRASSRHSVPPLVRPLCSFRDISVKGMCSIDNKHNNNKDQRKTEETHDLVQNRA